MFSVSGPVVIAEDMVRLEDGWVGSTEGAWQRRLTERLPLQRIPCCCCTSDWCCHVRAGESRTTFTSWPPLSSEAENLRTLPPFLPDAFHQRQVRVGHDELVGGERMLDCEAESWYSECALMPPSCPIP